MYKINWCPCSSVASLSRHLVPRGRPRLPAEVKPEHVLRSRKQYEEKNAGKRCKAARLRMQRKRAEIENDLCLKSAGRHKAALASARYRHKKQQKEWAEHKVTHAEKYCARKDEADGLRRKHLAMTSQAEEAGHATPAPVKKKLQIFYASPQRVACPGPARNCAHSHSPAASAISCKTMTRVPATDQNICRGQHHACTGSSHRRTTTHPRRAGRAVKFRHPFSSTESPMTPADASTASKGGLPWLRMHV
ncbi:hypothetical protein K438DRAFT_1776959 [Mycena galopus ATCC 62051]|nr:hypothetical protein K438DRAFT_1776959 [Mycena galopus ATCC 62051]